MSYDGLKTEKVVFDNSREYITNYDPVQFAFTKLQR